MAAHNPLRPMRSPRFKRVLRLDKKRGLFRLFRIMWERGGHSAKLSLALDSRFFRLPKRDYGPEWWVTLFGVRIHYLRGGGPFA